MLYHLTASDYEEFANVVVAARTALHLTAEGTAQFKEWLQCIRRYLNRIIINIINVTSLYSFYFLQI